MIKKIYSFYYDLDVLLIYNKYFCKFNNILLLFCFIYIIFLSLDSKLIYYKYAKFCEKGKKYFKSNKLLNSNSFYISICLPVYNMEKYIERALLSILNQSVQNFEIILVNDNSNDKTLNIINKYQINDERIKVINHNKKLGVYCSRRDAILNAKGDFILLMDPDDMLINRDLFKELFNYNSKYNLDVTEFLVYYQNENENNIYIRPGHIFNHWHDFGKAIINQPDLSNLFFYKPKSTNMTWIICRTIWNKLIRREIMIKSINYVEKYFRSRFLITADDTPINIMASQFGNNYSNVKISGYMYTKRKVSMSRGISKELDLIRGYNYLLYYKFLYGFVKNYGKNINFFLNDFNEFYQYLYLIKKTNITIYIYKAIKFFNKLQEIKNLPEKSNLIIQKLLSYFKNDSKKYK